MMGRLSSELLIVSQEISEDDWDLELEDISSRERLKPCRRSFDKDQTVAVFKQTVVATMHDVMPASKNSAEGFGTSVIHIRWKLLPYSN